MAAPRSRRPGFSRKAQLKIFTGYLIAFLGAFAGLLLLALSYFDPAAFAALRNTANEVTAPVSRTLTSGRVGIRNGWDETAAYFSAASKNADLKREAMANRVKLVEAQTLKAENRRLRKLLGVVEEQGPPVASGRLISSSASSTRRIAMLSAGSNDGVRRGMPVRSETGLIGRILDTSANVSRVLLVTDPDNVIPVRRARDGEVAFSEGRSDGRVNIRLINVGLNPFKTGDILVTSGNGGLYPPGVPVAIIAELTSDGAIARPVANPAATDTVIVQRVYMPEIIAEREKAAKDGKAETPEAQEGGE
ncbi:MAG: rod shape-determining protein MreC [Blastomonas sp.]